MDGWIKLHRKLLEWEWYRDSNTLHLFLHLLLQANHQPTRWRGLPIEQGQVLTGRHLLSKQTGLSERSIRTSLTRLKTTNELTIKTTSRFSIITIVKYNEYQIKDKQTTNKTTSKTTNERPANDQQTTTSKNDKNVKNVKKEDKDLPVPNWINKETFEAYIDMRKSIKKPLTPHATTLLVGKLQKLKDAGEDIQAVLEQSIFHSWQGVFAIKKDLPQKGSSKTAGNWARLEERERGRQEAMKNEPKKLPEGQDERH